MNMSVDKKKAVLRVKLFGLLREAMGINEVTLILDDTYITVEGLKRDLLICYPVLASLTAPFVVAVNRKVADNNTKIAHCDEVALLPFVSGG